MIFLVSLAIGIGVWCCPGPAPPPPPPPPPPTTVSGPELTTRPDPEFIGEDEDDTEDPFEGPGPLDPDWPGKGWGKIEGANKGNIWGEKWGFGGKNKIPPGPGEPGYRPQPGEPGYVPGPGEPGYGKPGEPGYVPGPGEPGYRPPKFGEPGYRPKPGEPGYRPLPGEPGYQSSDWQSNADLPENWKDMGNGFYGAAPPPWSYFPKNVGKPALCLLPPLKGPCFGKLVRYGYNPYKDSCEPFPYSGCGGNSNNFKTKEECEDMCGRLPGPDCAPDDSQGDSMEEYNNK